MLAEVVDEGDLIDEGDLEAKARLKLGLELLEAMKHDGVFLTHNYGEA